jgi:hypothetical protein
MVCNATTALIDAKEEQICQYTLTLATPAVCERSLLDAELRTLRQLGVNIP